MKKKILCIFCFVLMISIVGCGSQPKASEPVEEMVTLTLTPQYAGGFTDEKLQENIGTSFESAERQSDGSIVLKMTTEQYTNYIEMIRQVIISAAQNMVANTHNNITDISFNDNFSEFQVTVKTDTLQRMDADLAYFMFTAYGQLYQYLTTGIEDCPVGFSYVDADGNALEEVK